ncbi:MAG: hypothetical protein M1816_001199 [Peltula sp. TS41687]|nr:MAG: hypothetical protein M1816_001199 [Peltula sp. TS41687]
MASPPDYSALRALARGSGAKEEAVTVNMRHLISKVLARYMREWTTLRELIQNSADASASKVTIRYETQPSSTGLPPASADPTASLKHVCLNHTLRRLVVTNDGHPFQPSDWSRLKSIAEGNPDETKIGAFGVGFYSVFDITDDPLVRSGQEVLSFYYKGDALYTQMGPIPPGRSDFPGGPSDTDFILEYRDPKSPVPDLLSLGQFLATSLTFITVQTIEVWLDSWNILTITKKPSPAALIPIPKDLQTRTAKGKMRIVKVDRQVVQMDARWLNVVAWRNVQGPGSRGLTSGAAAGFLSRLSDTLSTVALNAPWKNDLNDLTRAQTATIFLNVTTAGILSSVDSTFKKEIERATKKSPPLNTKISVLTPLLDQSSLATVDSVDLFATVLPKKSGNIFIGFPTSQTTGCLAHVSAPSVIPTVERENIDLNPGCIGDWNRELLGAAGVLCRIAWVCESEGIKRKLSSDPRKGTFTKEEIAGVLPEAIQLCQTFTFQESSPSSQVATLLHSAFWRSYDASILILSSQGILPSHQVRLASEDLSSFVQGLPVVPEELVARSKRFIALLRSMGYLTDITVGDVKKELDNKALNEKQLRGFLEWSGKSLKEESLSAEDLRSMMSVAVTTVNGKPVLLRDIHFYINPVRMPAEMPYPSDTAPFSCTKGLPKGIPEALGWKELQLVRWLEWLLERSGGSAGLAQSEDITLSPTFSATVLAVIYKSWENLSQYNKEQVVRLIQDRTVMPTKMGMKRPAEAYVPSVKLFDDLPIVSGLTGMKDKFLVALGVRNTPDVEVVIRKMFAQGKASDGIPHEPTGSWNHVHVIRYLASMANDIPSKDFERLRTKAIFPAEDETDREKPTAARYKITELFEPKHPLRKLRLPVLQWPSYYRLHSMEAKFLTCLGLRAYPSPLDLIKIMAKASADGEMDFYEETLTYFIVNHHSNGYANLKYLETDTIPPYLPLEGHDHRKLAAPAECFLNERSTILGFEILKKHLHIHAVKFGVKEHPPIDECVKRLMKAQPGTKIDARLMFAYFGSRLAEIKERTLQQLGSVPFVPIIKENGAKIQGSKSSPDIRFISPQSCYLEHNSIYGEIFDYVDFGTEANAFLEACGSKRSPDAKELAKLIAKGPATVFDKLTSDGESQPHQKYERLLKFLASHLGALKAERALFKELKLARCLLAYKKVPRQTNQNVNGNSSTVDDDADNDEKVWLLASARQIVLVKDDSIYYESFKFQILTAPEKDDLEEFYHALGSPYLNAIVEEHLSIGPIEHDQSRAVESQKRILERVPLFLHRQPKDDVKHDAAWLEKNLQVEVVKSIHLHLILREHNFSYKDKRTAAAKYDQQRGWVLCITKSLELRDVCLALSKLLLTQPNVHHAMTLGNILSMDLATLRKWGYNVDRILLQKEEAAQMAKDERQKQLDEERKQREDERKQRDGEKKRSQEAGSSGKVSIPGAFAETSDDEATSEKSKRSGKATVDTIRKGFGTRPHKLSALKSDSVDDARDADRENLRKVIRACRPYDLPELYNKPQTTLRTETITYCDPSPGGHLSFYCKTGSGIKIFLTKDLRDKDAFIRSHGAALCGFADILMDLHRMFDLPPEVLNIFNDEESYSIAFNNTRGSIFCNFQYFLPFWTGIERQRSGQIVDVNYKGEAAKATFITLCHELAHNAVHEHSAEHEFYLEKFMEQFMFKFTQLAASYAKQPSYFAEPTILQPLSHA